jgi:small subunit ribosomal protein S16
MLRAVAQRRMNIMAVVLRMTRRGSNRRPFYHIVAANSRAKRDGRFLDDLGVYLPRGDTQLALNEEKAKYWLASGAKPSATVAKLLKRAGISAAPVSPEKGA